MATALDLLMSTKEDVNLLSQESDICTIDAKTRAIFVPSTIVVGGVQSDKNAERIKFSCPKIVGDNLDLSKFSVRINFENVSSVDFNVSIKDQYICDDVAVDGENVTFSWLIGRNAARYMGTVRFIVCAVKTDSDSNISVEWNTTIAEVPVLEGIEIDQPQIGQEEKDVINQLLELTKNTSAEAVQNVNSAKEQAIKDIQSVSQPDTTLTIEGGLAEAKATGDAIGSLKEDLSDYSVDVIGAENNIIPYPYKSTIVSESILIQSSGRNITAVGTATRKSTFTIFGSWGNTTDMFCVAGETYMVCGIDMFTRIVFFNASGNEVLTVVGNGEPQIFTVPQSAVGCNMYWQANINVKTEYDESIRPRIYNINETILKKFETLHSTITSEQKTITDTINSYVKNRVVGNIELGTVANIDTSNKTIQFGALSYLCVGSTRYNISSKTYDLTGLFGAFCFYDPSNDKFVGSFSSGFVYMGAMWTDAYITDWHIPKEKLTINGMPYLLANHKGEKINCIGDSMTFGVNASKPYYSWFKQFFNFATVNVYGVSGSSIAPKVDTYPEWEQGIQSFYERYSAMNNDADYITIFGGVNDWVTGRELGTLTDRVSTTFCGAFRLMIEGLIAKYPHQRIFVFTSPQNDYINRPANMNGSNPYYGNTEGKNRLGYTQKQYMDAMISICKDYAITCYDMYSNLIYGLSGVLGDNHGTSGLYGSDGLHPNNELHKRIAKIMAETIIANS